MTNMESPHAPFRPPVGPEPTDEELQNLDMRQEAADRNEHMAYLRSIAGPRTKRGGRRTLWISLSVIAALAIAGAVIYVLFVKDSSERQPDPKRNESSQKAQTPPDDEDISIKTKRHDSPAFFLGFDYPEDWTISDDGSGKLLARSPAMNLKTVSGKTEKCIITLRIQGKQDALPEFKNGNGIAVLASEKLTYEKPTQSQRAQTYLSFVGYVGSPQGSLDGLYITGDIGYQKDQAVPEVDIVRVDPLITVGFTSVSGAAVSLRTSNWNEKSLFTASIKTLLTTLSVQ